MPTPGGTTARGYGYAHRRLRKALLPWMPGSKCTRCGEVLRASDEVDLDHTEDRKAYLGFAHKRCNRAAGARKANAARKPPLGTPSREW